MVRLEVGLARMLSRVFAAFLPQFLAQLQFGLQACLPLGVLGAKCGLLGWGCSPGKAAIRTGDDEWLDVVWICLLIVLILGVCLLIVLTVGWPVRGLGRHSIPLARYSIAIPLTLPVVEPIVVPILAPFVFSLVVLVLALAPKGPLVPHFVFSFSETLPAIIRI